MSQMAADVFVEMTRDMPGRAPHPQLEGDAAHPQVEVEREFFGDVPAPPTSPASRRAERWAREHAGRTLLATTVAVGGLARLLRHDRRRQRSG